MERDKAPLYSAADICAILDKAHQTCVVSLEIEGLKLSRDASPSAIGDQGPVQPVSDPVAHDADARDRTLLSPADITAMHELERSQALIESPLDFEQDQIDSATLE